jgi:hypothetical protein
VRSFYDLNAAKRLNNLSFWNRNGDRVAQRVLIDWDDLELALTMHMDEQRSYLNLKTGKIELAANDIIGADAGLSEDEIETGFAEGCLIPVEPLSSSVEYRWMAQFAETVADGRLRDMLELALDGRGAFRRFKIALSNYPAERERWFAFRQERLDQEMAAWLADQDIEPTNPLPKGGAKG